jgi:excinuclease UvrABC nuclease subunit
MNSGIYKITNLKNNKIYIGRAVDLKNRKWRHWCFLHPNQYK